MIHVIIVYESVYGNTKKIAMTLAEVLDAHEDIECIVKKSREIHTDDLMTYDVIIFGAPNHDQSPAGNLLRFIDRAAIVALDGRRFTTFDTYTGGNKGIAQSKLEAYVRKTLPGLELLCEGFSAKVKTQKGPLDEEEPKRAREFAERLLVLLTQ